MDIFLQGASVRVTEGSPICLKDALFFSGLSKEILDGFDTEDMKGSIHPIILIGIRCWAHYNAWRRTHFTKSKST